MRHMSGMLGVLAIVGWGSLAQAATLDEVSRAAEAHSFELRLAQEQTAQARTYRWQAMAQQLPQVSTQWTYTRNEFEVAIPDELRSCILVNPTGGDDFLPIAPEDCFDSGGSDEELLIQTQDGFEGSIRLVQPLLRAQAAPAWRSATKIWRAAEAEEERARQQVRLGAARVYYGVITAREALEVAESGVALARTQLDLAKKQVEVGASERRILLQAELGVSRAERDLYTAREQRVTAQEAFRRLTGMAAPEVLEVPEPQALGGDLDSALQQAASRADVRAASLRVAAAKDERLARDLEWAPTIDFAFLEQINALPTALSPNPFQWRVALQLNWSLFDGGLRIARSRELASRSRAAAILVEQRAQAAEEDVRVAWERLARASKAFDAVDAEIALAGESLQLAEASFGAGGATWIDVEQARLALASSRLAWITERMNRDLAYLEARLAAGDL